ncbi:hypothetical protein DLM76_04240 [Leptospira yasudae]|uniref:Uncharacterized protein n=1 Tax=Leptospira yasudae TaxID=2202201 RepID=A0ABX9M7B2_9LEPT|nr:hypothetical protein DLM77_04075 [Leptospira yasudae]RHX96172.1 hypothetical protein DLM76_04240 [Leptospira yasudae]
MTKTPLKRVTEGRKMRKSRRKPARFSEGRGLFLEIGRKSGNFPGIYWAFPALHVGVPTKS